MKQFLKILKFELMNFFTNKIFIGITIFSIVIISIFTFFPRIESFFEVDEPNDITPKYTMLISGSNASKIADSFSQTFLDYKVIATDESVDSIKEKVLSGEAECAFIFESLIKYTYYVDNLSMYDSNQILADETLKEIYKINAMLESGLSEEDILEISSVEIQSKSEILGKDQMQNYFYTYIMIMALYMVIILYGQMIATNVASEKSSRAMELLITSAKPVSMMFGKVFASCIAGFIQLASIFGTALITFKINEELWADNTIVTSIFNMPVELIVYMLLFFILGFLIYAFLYGAIGSTVSKLEDINVSSTPITLLFVIAFMVVLIGISSNEVDTPIMTICSFIPFTSPMAMFTRIAMSSVPLWQIIISISILIVSSGFIGYISAKIYRMGVLLYGTPPKLKNIIKMLKNSK